MGKRTGLVTLPLLPYGENEKQKYYPGSISISPDTLEHFYVDIFRSLMRNGVRRVILLNGHGGNRETIARASRTARDFGMIVAIPEWWSLVKDLMPELQPEKGVFMTELAVSLYIGGKDLANFRDSGYMRVGDKYTMRELFGDFILPLGFNNFEYKGGRITIPVQAWDLDIEGPPYIGEEVAGELYERGRKALEGLVEYLVDFTEEFKRVDITDALKSKD